MKSEVGTHFSAVPLRSRRALRFIAMPMIIKL